MGLIQLCSDEELRDIVNYCAEETKRQGDPPVPFVGQMTGAWLYALTQQDNGEPLTVDLIKKLGQFIKPNENKDGFRTNRIFIIGLGRQEEKVKPDRVRPLMELLVEQQDQMTPFEFYRSFEEIHPFMDGNGRVGKVVLNWKNNSLRKPIFPPNDFWGEWIVNP